MNNATVEFKAQGNIYTAYKIQNPQSAERVSRITQQAADILKKNIEIYTVKPEHSFAKFSVKTKLPKNTVILLMPDNFEFERLTDDELLALVLSDYFRSRLLRQITIVVFAIIALTVAAVIFLNKIINPYAVLVIFVAAMFYYIKMLFPRSVWAINTKIKTIMGTDEHLLSLLEKLCSFYKENNPANAANIRSRINKIKNS
jgi:hypothetical protein